MNIDVLKSGWTEYELIDSGDRLKLERFGNVTVIRSEPKAWWKPSVSRFVAQCRRPLSRRREKKRKMDI